MTNLNLQISFWHCCFVIYMVAPSKQHYITLYFMILLSVFFYFHFCKHVRLSCVFLNKFTYLLTYIMLHFLSLFTAACIFINTYFTREYI